MATFTDNGGGAPNGSDKEFTYSFPVIQTEDVKVALNGVTQATTKYAVDNVSNPTKITFNNTSIDFGNKAYIVEESDVQERRQNAIIYSGVINSKTGINNTNQFPIGEDITRAVDPASGSIQKLHAENTNLIILQERKVNRAPVDKDVIFTQEGLPVTTDSTKVVGTPSAFEGNYGISRDPGSFAVYGYNKYFTDRDRSVVMQLGPNGLNEISNYFTGGPFHPQTPLIAGSLRPCGVGPFLDSANG